MWLQSILKVKAVGIQDATLGMPGDRGIFQRQAQGSAAVAERAQALRLMAASLMDMARQIEGEFAAEPVFGDTRPGAAEPAADPRALLDRTRQDYANRRLRRQFFGDDLFGEPAWDILLDLYQARLKGRMITVTSACIAADVPLSTALRWLGVLEQQGLVERSRNTADQRSTWVRLTDRAATGMTEYFGKCLLRARRTEY